MFLRPAQLCWVAPIFATGCGSETGTIAAGVGLGVAALGAISWMAYRRALPAAVRLQTPLTDHSDIRTEFLRLFPLLKEGPYAPVLGALTQRTAQAWKAAGNPPSLKPFLDDEIVNLTKSLRDRKRNALLQRLLDALAPPPISPAPPPRFPIASVADVKALEPYLLGPLAAKAEAQEVLALLCTKGLEHTESDVVATSSTLLDRMLEERLSPGLRPESDLFTAVDAVTVLKTVGLLAKQEAPAGRAIETLAMEGIFHGDTEVSTLAIRSLAEIADAIPHRLPSTALIALRLRGFSPKAPLSMTAAVIDALSRIAAPAGSRPTTDPTDSIQALHILFWDGLTQPASHRVALRTEEQNEEIVVLTRRALLAVFERRPDIFSDEMRSQLLTQ